MMPSQKSGTLMPNTTKPSVSRLVQRPPVAARMPSGTPTRTASSIDSAVSSKVTGRRCASSSESGAWLTISLPRSPRSRAPAQFEILLEQAAIEAELVAQLGDVLRRSRGSRASCAPDRPARAG